MKRLISVLLLLSVLLPLAACQPALHDTNPTAPPTSAPTEPTVPTEPTDPIEMKTIYVLVEERHTKTFDNWQVFYVSELNTYDEEGRLIQRELGSMSGSKTIQTPELDEYGRVVRLTHIKDGVTYIREYTYDQNGNVASEKQMHNGKLTCSEVSTYDADGNILTWEQDFGSTGNRVQYIYENGCLVKDVWNETEENIYTYDEQGRISVRTRYLEGVAYESYYYTYSEDGLTTYIDCPEYGTKTVRTVDENGNVVYEEINGEKIEYTYLAIQIPADSPRKN